MANNRRWPRTLTEEECRARAAFFRRQSTDLEEIRRLDGKIKTLLEETDLNHRALQQMLSMRRAMAQTLHKAQAQAVARGLVGRNETAQLDAPGGVVAEAYVDHIIRNHSAERHYPGEPWGRVEYR